MEEKDERRLRIVYVNCRNLLRLLCTAHHPDGPENLRLPKFSSLPEGYLLKAVTYDWERDAIAFKVWHESFSAVPEGGVIPGMSGELELSEVAYCRADLQQVQILKWESILPKNSFDPPKEEKPKRRGWEFLGHP